VSYGSVPPLYPITLYANIQYSLTSSQQGAIQMFLRTLPLKLQDTECWNLLHAATYTFDWSDTPKFLAPDAEDES
jgi:hypothetical protein